MYNKRAIGNEKEKMVVSFLQEKGYLILTTNYYCQCGEIDIIAKDKTYIVFIEVKYRKNTKNGFPEEAINKRKMHSIIKTANHYLLRHGISFDSPCRFDVVVILDQEITLYQNAFMIGDGYIF